MRKRRLEGEEGRTGEVDLSGRAKGSVLRPGWERGLGNSCLGGAAQGGACRVGKLGLSEQDVLGRGGAIKSCLLPLCTG